MANTALPVPEEILERILELAFAPDPATRPSSPRATHVLLVCKAFERIALPFLYAALHLRTRVQADSLAATLRARPALGECVRALCVASPAYGHAFAAVVEAMAARPCRPLDVLDVKLDAARDEELGQDAFEAFCCALRRCPDARTLVVRKSGYLTHDKTVRAVADLASGVRMCSSVERVDLKYKPSPLPAALLSAASLAPHQFVCDPLAAALSTLPRLKVVRAQLPAIWNPFLLEVAANAALLRVELVDRDDAPGDADPGPACTGADPAACEGRLPCRGRGRGMSDVAHAYPSSSPVPSSSSSSPASFPPDRQPPPRPACPCPCRLGVAPEMAAIPEPCDAAAALPPSLFMTQAAKHAHLHALILAGRRHMFLARMQARDARVRAGRAAGCVCAGARLVGYVPHSSSAGRDPTACSASFISRSASLSQSQEELLPPSPTAFAFGSRTRAHTVLPSATGSRRSGRS